MASPNTATYETAEPNAASEREQLILEHLPQVRWIASRLHERLASSNLDDLISIGIIGLINAIDNFDPAYNVKLKTYAEHKIRGAILDSVRGSDGIPAHKRKRLKEIQRAMVTLEQRLMRSPEEDEIAAELNLDLETYRTWLSEVQGVRIGSLDAVGERDGERSLMEFLADEDGATPAQLLERADLERLVAEGLRKISRTEGTVLDLYYRQELSIREIASIMGIHITRVSQLKSQAVLRLRAYMQRHWPTSRGVY